MSYCRWSSDNWRCDLYCYEDANGGWTTHVAGRKKLGWWVPSPSFRLLKLGKVGNWVWRVQYRLHRFTYGLMTYRDLRSPYAGQSFNDPTLEDFRARVQVLRDSGLRVPDHVFAAIEEEIRLRDEDDELNEDGSWRCRKNDGRQKCD